jgi:hypothetical protein
MSASGTTFTGFFAPMTGAFAAVAGRIFELLVLKSALTVVLYSVAFTTHTILKLQSMFAKKSDE